MSEPNDSFGSDILKGLKRVLFSADQSSESTNTRTAESVPPTATTVLPVPGVNEPVSQDDNFKKMKLRVYQLLETMNKPGVDFFEVWNASVEMGGPSNTTVKSAYTSLKFADKSLSKSKLQESGSAYISGLKSIIETESQKRLEEKARLDKEREQLKSSLADDINSLEQQIAALQEKLMSKKSEKDTINEKYAPKIADIDSKIEAGRKSVTTVIQEMQQVLEIINKELN